MTPEGILIEKLLRIVDKQQADVDFILNPVQRLLDEQWSSRNIIPKPRQPGISSYVLARFTILALGQRNVRAVVISHEAEATERLLSRVKYYIQHLRCPAPVLKYDSRNEISFPKTNSVIYIGTAGSKAFGRGDTITHLHCSEAAFWDDPASLTRGLFQAVPMNGGEITIESTGNGRGNWYHNRCLRALAGESSYKLHFFPWFIVPEYRVPLSPEEQESINGNLLEEWREPEVVSMYHLSAEQLAWRRIKLDELDGDLAMFNQEYPSQLDDCFQGTGRSYFPESKLVGTEKWEKETNNLWRLVDHPMPGRLYVLGADVAAGIGKDRSVIEVLDVETQEQVAEWFSDRVDPAAFAGHIAELAKRYGDAYVGVESNNHGILTLKELKDQYPIHLIHKHTVSKMGAAADNQLVYLTELGIKTTARNKPLMCGNLRKALRREMVIHSSLLKAELDAFVEHPDGSLGAEIGAHDDMVMALAISLACLNAAALYGKPWDGEVSSVSRADNPFSLESIQRELRSRRESLPISAKVW